MEPRPPSGQRVVTAAMDRMTFLHPVFVGELVTVRASVNAAYLTLVALDAEGRPAAVPAVAPETPEEERRAREAQLRRDNRLAERDQLTADRSA